DICRRPLERFLSRSRVRYQRQAVFATPTALRRFFACSGCGPANHSLGVSRARATPAASADFPARLGKPLRCYDSVGLWSLRRNPRSPRRAPRRAAVSPNARGATFLRYLEGRGVRYQWRGPATALDGRASLVARDL